MASRIHAVPPEDPDDGDEPVDPFDTDRLRYDEAEFACGGVTSRKVITAIKVRKPGTQEWFRLHPAKEYQLPTALFLRENEELLRPETYLVLPECRDLFGKNHLTPVRLRLAVNSLETVFLWDLKVPKDGVMTDYFITLHEIAEEAENNWVRLEWSNADRVYHYHYAEGDLGDPQFPQGKTMRDWLALGFKGRIIDSEDHPVVAEFKGRSGA